MKNRISAWIVLGVITIVAGLGLAFTNQVTKEPIRLQAVAAEEKAKKLVLPGAETFEEITLADGGVLFVAKTGEEVLGYVGKTEVKGYGGLLEVIAGVQADGTITGINVGGASFSETPGLGAKARDTAFTSKFSGKKSPVRLGDSENDNQVDAITAATITSNAVVNAVNSIAKQVKAYLNPDEGKPVQAAEGISYAGEAVGFKGESNPVYVVVTVKDDGTISGVKVGDERFGETPGYGAAALEPEFAQQFIGKTLPLALTDIDGISGSTMTTTAVVTAINQAFDSKNIVQLAGAAPEGTTFAGEAVGFKGNNNPIYVEVTVKGDGTISEVKIGDDRFGETEGYGAAALEPDFSAQFVGKSLPLTITDIEAISGATITSEAVVSAINQAYESKNIIRQSGSQPDGTTYAGEAVGFKGNDNPVYVEVTIKEDGTITAVKVGDDRFGETEGYGAAALETEFTDQFNGKTVPISITDIDGISGATITTQAVISAINAAYESKNIISGPAPAATAQPTAEPTAEPTPVAIPENALTASAKGYEGPVAVTAAFDADGRITFFLVGDAQFAETDGVGSKALEPSFAAQFIGKLPPLAIRAADQSDSESTIDAIAGATITSKAVLEAINTLHAGQFAQLAVSEAPAATEAAAAPLVSGDEVTITKQGFMGPVTVKVTFLEDGTIGRLVLDTEGFAETPGYGALALEDAYTAQFAGKQAPLSLQAAGQAENPGTVRNIANPDTVTRATVTAQAIVDAVNEAYVLFQQRSQSSVTKQGFMGPVTVEARFNADGSVREVVIQADGFKETPGYGALALDTGFVQRLIGKVPPLSIRGQGEAESPSLVENLVNPDTFTSATATMQAILDAINEAFESRP